MWTGRNVGGCQATRILWRKIGLAEEPGGTWTRCPTYPIILRRRGSFNPAGFSTVRLLLLLCNLCKIRSVMSSSDSRHPLTQPGNQLIRVVLTQAWTWICSGTAMSRCGFQESADERLCAASASSSCSSSSWRRLQHLFVFVAACKNPQAHVFAY